MEKVVFAEERTARGTRVIVPVFGATCVCCNAATERLQYYNPSTDRVRAGSIPVPVCIDCKGHAMVTPTGLWLAMLALLLGGVLGGIGIHRSDVEEVAIGAVLAAGAVTWFVALFVRMRRWRRAGHHPGLTMNVDTGRCVLQTTNVTLADALVATNPFARRRPVRGERGQVPATQAEGGVTAPDPNDLTAEERAALLAEALGPRPGVTPKHRGGSR